MTITAPGHPLYRRSFEVVSVTHGSRLGGLVEILYRDGITLRVPLNVTDLSVLVEEEPRSKLTATAVRDLLALVKEHESCLPPLVMGDRQKPIYASEALFAYIS